VTGPPASGKSLLLEVMTGRHALSNGRRSYPAFADWHADSVLGVAPRFTMQLVSTEEQRRASARVASFHQARWHALFSEPETVATYLGAHRVFGLSEFEVPPDGLIDSEHDNRRADLLERMAIDQLLSRRLAALSNGEMRKVLLARAILARPRILFLDDPLGGLDPESRPRIVEVLTRICASAAHSSPSAAVRTAWLPPGVPPTLVIATPRPEELGRLATHTFELECSRAFVPSKPKSENYLSNAVPPLSEQDSVPSNAESRDSVTAVPQTEDSDPAGRPLLRINGASVVAGATRILNSVTFEVHPGEHWLITGPNGSGKSTLLALLLWDHPQSYLADLEVLGLRALPGTTRFERQRGIGFMAPELALHYPPGWPVRDVVTSGFMATIGSYAEPNASERAIAARWMQRLGLDVVAETPFGRLSEAEQRRALLCRALVRTPRLLFLDEPTQGLSSIERRSVHDLLDAVVESNKVTLLLVSHHPDERPRCMSHHLALRLGSIVHNGPLTTDSSVDSAAHG
jgi:molybdate transport system ATP-binding protein